MSNKTAILGKCFLELSRMANDAIDNSQIKNIKDFINKYAVMSAIAGGGAAILPGGAAAAAMVVQTGFIWSLYVKISNELGISIKENKLKFIASAVLTNITTNAGLLIAGHAAATTFSLIPGIGSVISVMIEAMIGYLIIYVAAILYLQFITRLFKANNGKCDLSSMSEDELKKEIKKASSEVNMKEAINEGKQAYHEAKKNGDFEKAKNNPQGPNCNATLDKNMKYCSECGLKIK